MTISKVSSRALIPTWISSDVIYSVGLMTLNETKRLRKESCQKVKNTTLLTARNLRTGEYGLSSS